VLGWEYRKGQFTGVVIYRAIQSSFMGWRLIAAAFPNASALSITLPRRYGLLAAHRNASVDWTVRAAMSGLPLSVRVVRCRKQPSVKAGTRATRVRESHGHQPDGVARYVTVRRYIDDLGT